jgi:hypothetical protein
MEEHIMSDPKTSLDPSENRGNEKDSSQEDVQQVANPVSEPEADVEAETEQPLYRDRNPNWTEKDLPPRRSGS